MNFEVKVIEDSISQAGKRLTTITATYPRFIHAEIMTHRDRARNAASSRAIPWPKMSEMISEHPVIPIKWGMEQSGMQTGDEIPERMRQYAEGIWLQAMEAAVFRADMLANIGKWFAAEYPALAQPGDEMVRIHKSIPNRIVEPWMWITVVMTATEWKNFFRLRCHPDAEVHFQKIACMIRDALAESTPVERLYHLPFVQDDERNFDLPIEPHDPAYGTPAVNPDTDLDRWCRISVARCARVSYLTHEGTRDPAKDLELFDRLCQGSGFGHWSPHEHVAFAHSNPRSISGPYRGWEQYRKYFPTENEAG
jgi:hypothetical protein